MARLRTRIWIEAYQRRANFAGAFMTVLSHGDDDAGAVLIVRRDRNTLTDILLPASMQNGARKWVRHPVSSDPEDQDRAEQRLQRERDIDPDIWIVEIEQCDRDCLLTDDLVGDL